MQDGYTRLDEVLASAKKRGISLRKWASERNLDPAFVARLRARQVIPNLRAALAMHPTISIFAWREIVEQHRKAA